MKLDERERTEQEVSVFWALMEWTVVDLIDYVGTQRWRINEQLLDGIINDVVANLLGYYVKDGTK